MSKRPVPAVAIILAVFAAFMGSCDQSERDMAVYGPGHAIVGDDDTSDDDAAGDDDSADDDLDDSLDDVVDDDTFFTTTVTTASTSTTALTTTTFVPTTTTSTTTTIPGPSDIFFINFESYELGPLGAPWDVTQSGVSAGTVIDWAREGSGHVLEIDGGANDGEYYLARYLFPDTAADMAVSFDAYIESGAWMGFRLGQNYEGEPFPEIYLYTDDQGEFQALDGDYLYVSCGVFPAEQWVSVRLDVFFAGTYNVLMDGEPMPECQNLGLLYGDGYPFGFIDLLDWSDAGSGGSAYYDNLRGGYL